MLQDPAILARVGMVGLPEEQITVLGAPHSLAVMPAITYSGRRLGDSSARPGAPVRIGSDLARLTLERFVAGLAYKCGALRNKVGLVTAERAEAVLVGGVEQDPAVRTLDVLLAARIGTDRSETLQRAEETPGGVLGDGTLFHGLWLAAREALHLDARLPFRGPADLAFVGPLALVATEEDSCDGTLTVGHGHLALLGAVGAGDRDHR